MQNFKLAKDFLGFKKGSKLIWDNDKCKYILISPSVGMILLQDIVVEANPEIFEPVLCLEDELDLMLKDFFKESMSYACLQSSSHLDETIATRIKIMGNKIIKLFEDRK